ncbi:MAG: sigma-54-dependent Fis family transcriptional regulator [Candidatus Tectomicrobia bacterium]|uniref:Sigma-54-dependent Fis family transcriptional regulator n=1 Tax=Tectimicrobiota bacterium TaxID=2528274 RepID=A0A932CRI3_UNCTE|nr:sigma-54-dependent Fis family transcriptional regulator [Candidatus Tectomicrobia bacterium]
MRPSQKILVVDDEKSMRDFLHIFLRKEGYEVIEAEAAGEAIAFLRQEEECCDLIISDIIMPDVGGLEVLKEAIHCHPFVPVLMITAFATTETALEAMRIGAYDYITKPFKLEELRLVIKNALEKRRLQEENSYLRGELSRKKSSNGFVGRSEKIVEVFKVMGKIAASDVTVLIRGESGTGKELVARELHQISPRCQRPFVPVNCAAIPKELLESELFGHERGSFTGAMTTKMGKFEQANGGTIFLDEIGDMDMALQGKILRVLQEKEIDRVGGNGSIKIDVRAIAATNQDLEVAIKERRFREDLYYRLNVIPISLPSLRERREDIPLLVQHFIEKHADKIRRTIKGISPTALRLLEEYHWPGNVRELENIVERAIALETGIVITPESLPEEVRQANHRPPSPLRAPERIELPQEGLNLEATLDALEKDLLLRALERTQGAKLEAARLLQLNFRSFRYRLKKHRIG